MDMQKEAPDHLEVYMGLRFLPLASACNYVMLLAKVCYSQLHVRHTCGVLTACSGSGLVHEVESWGEFAAPVF
eukprot:scaffold306572_cov21-Tisochrysis_lutea.AAC.2